MKINFKDLQIDKRLFTFDVDLMQRLADIRMGYNPECNTCLDLDYYLDEETRKPTICVECASKKMIRVQKRIKDMLRYTDKDINKGGNNESGS